MDQVQLKYNTSETETVGVLRVYGASEPDIVEKFGITHEMLDGSLLEQIAGGRRSPRIEFYIMTALQRRKLVEWWLDPDRLLVCVMTAPTGLSVQAGTGTMTGNRYYRVAAVDIVGQGIAAASVSIVTAASGAVLAWAAVSGARRYKIYRSDDAEATYDFLDYSETLAYTDTGVTAYKTDIATASLGAASTIAVVSPGTLEFQWGNDVELERFATMELRETSIFSRTAKFPI